VFDLAGVFPLDFPPPIRDNTSMNKEMNMQVEIDKLELEVKRQQEIALTLANLLNEKIDEVTELRAVKNSLNAQLVDKIREMEELKKENDDLREALHQEIYS
jgi:uncharacterized coiled-coil DUF342 family protein